MKRSTTKANCFRPLFYHPRICPCSLQPWARLPHVRHHVACLSTSKEKYDSSFRKQLKDERQELLAEKKRVRETNNSNIVAQRLQAKNWELTVGIEIHAQLNTRCKLFSEAKTSYDGAPNRNTVPYDLAFPGTQPVLQKAVIVPALRAALALNCTISTESTFDRKHYFYHDQPAGYQITQYYHPFAKNGGIDLTIQDDPTIAKGTKITIGIERVQLEQDTAKSTTIPEESLALLDFNRVGHPLIEIITRPEIYTPTMAAACVRKIQSILQAVNAVTTGMELGGLRADVNVSVAPKGSRRQGNLGQRVEIKNLSTLQSVEAAIVAEQARQISLLTAGDHVVGETRGWSLRSTETTRLRGKEGEVDYRYMPDADIPPLYIGNDLINHIKTTMPDLPDMLVSDLVTSSNLTVKDAKTLSSLEDGLRLDYFDEVKEALAKVLSSQMEQTPPQDTDLLISNWVIHEVGSLLSLHNVTFNSDLVPAIALAKILHALATRQIPRSTAKDLLNTVFVANIPHHISATQPNKSLFDPTIQDSVNAHEQNHHDKESTKIAVNRSSSFTQRNGNTSSIDIDSLLTSAILATPPPASPARYDALIEQVVQAYPSHVSDIMERGKTGKITFLLGQILRRARDGDTVVDPVQMEALLRKKLGVDA